MKKKTRGECSSGPRNFRNTMFFCAAPLDKQIDISYSESVVIIHHYEEPNDEAVLCPKGRQT